MVSNRELSENFANGKTNGKGSNMFIDGKTIYSYGYHFPIAVKEKDFYLFNSERYSPTTAKHKAYVLSAINRNAFYVIELRGCDIGNINSQMERNRTEITVLKQKVIRAKSENMRNRHNERIAYLQKQNELLENLKKVGGV